MHTRRHISTDIFSSMRTQIEARKHAQGFTQVHWRPRVHVCTYIRIYAHAHVHFNVHPPAHIPSYTTLYLHTSTCARAVVYSHYASQCAFSHPRVTRSLMHTCALNSGSFAAHALMHTIIMPTSALAKDAHMDTCALAHLRCHLRHILIHAR